MDRYRLTLLVLVMVVGAGVTSARGSAVFTLSRAPDGGVMLVGNGDAGVTYPFDNSYTLILDTGGVLGPVASNFSTSPVGGSITVGPDTVSLINATINPTLTEDHISFLLNGSLNSGETTFNNVTATWSVSTLAFSSLTPGTYNVKFIDAVVDVVPEPASAALLGVGGLMILRRRTA